MAKDIFSISGKRWFDKTHGNTYHSVEVSKLNKDKNEFEEVGKEDFVYGYDDAYKQTAFKIAQKNGYKGDYSDFIRDKSNSFNVYDVKRKRDL